MAESTYVSLVDRESIRHVLASKLSRRLLRNRPRHEFCPFAQRLSTSHAEVDHWRRERRGCLFRQPWGRPLSTCRYGLSLFSAQAVQGTDRAWMHYFSSGGDGLALRSVIYGATFRKPLLRRPPSEESLSTVTAWICFWRTLFGGLELQISLHRCARLFNYPSNPLQVQNLFLQQLAESGIVGLVLFWTPIIVLARWLWRFRADGLALAGVALLVTFSGHGLVDDLFAFTPQYLFLVLAMLGIVTSRVNFLRRSARFSYSLAEGTRARSASSRPLTVPFRSA